ncbi:MAG TPA: hypothetical protein VJ183_00020 [Chloroflexia bacterium]|nr:hypothetical protein [Chloroflexia bacterium]
MQPDFVPTILSWASALLLYPGLLFGLALALASEWIFALARPLITPSTYRSRATQRTLLQPLYTFLKLSGRRNPASFSPDNSAPMRTTTPSSLLAAVSAIAPILALALLPFPGSPLNRPGGPQVDLLTILLLLAAGPLFKAAWRLLSGDLVSLQGARDLGRLLTGLLPSILALAALVEVSDTRSLAVTSLTAAPETPGQTIVRLLAGLVLLAALPWWLDWRDTTTSGDNAGIHAGRLLQTSAMAALWSLLILPAPGDRTWAIAIEIFGALFAYLSMRAVPHLWVPIRRERDAASLVWATALPVAILALAIALWTGA